MALFSLLSERITLTYLWTHVKPQRNYTIHENSCYFSPFHCELCFFLSPNWTGSSFRPSAFSSCGAWALDRAHVLSSSSAWAKLLLGLWDPSSPTRDHTLMSPDLKGRCPTMGQPGKYYSELFEGYACVCAKTLQLCKAVWSSLAPLSMEFFRQEYWSGLPFPTPKLN